MKKPENILTLKEARFAVIKAIRRQGGILSHFKSEEITDAARELVAHNKKRKAKKR